MKYFPLYFICMILMACNNAQSPDDYLNLQPRLSGKWVSQAFDGELHEEWKLGLAGWMEQEGYYIENGDTSYAARTQIQKVDDDIILFSVIRDSNPKIFKAASISENMIIFKNDDYTNPYEVKYEFLTDTSYRRTIRGTENDSLVVYKFNFEKVKKNNY